MAVKLMKQIIKKGLVGMIKGYQVLLSPIIGPRCRFTPTCSQYAIESLEKFGIISGGWQSITRISRCHPFSKGGVDLVRRQ